MFGTIYKKVISFKENILLFAYMLDTTIFFYLADKKIKITLVT